MQGNRERGCFGLATGAFERTLGRAAEEARWRIKDARKGARGWKARGSRNWRVAGANMRQKCFSQNKRALGVFTALGFVKLFLEGALGLGGLYGSFWGLWGSAGFVRAQGGIALRFPFPFTDLL